MNLSWYGLRSRIIHGPTFVTNIKYDAIIVSIATGDFIKIHESISGSTPTRETSYMFQMVSVIVVVLDMMLVVYFTENLGKKNIY